MKRDFNSIRKDLEKLTDVDYLKKELNRLTTEIKKFDVNVHLTPQAKAKLKGLEQTFEELRKRVTKVQKQVDSEIGKFVAIISKAGFGPKAAAKKTSKKTSAKKASTAATSSKKATAKKTTRKKSS